ncbi:MAG: glycosyltransferase [Azospirillaceae bacterium]
MTARSAAAATPESAPPAVGSAGAAPAGAAERVTGRAADQPDIALVVPNLRGGGAQRMCVNLKRAFDRRGLAVDLVVWERDGQLVPDFEGDASVHYLGASSGLAAVPKLARYLARRRPKGLVSFMRPTNLACVAARALARAPTTVLISERNNPNAQLAGSAPWKRVLWRSMMRALYPRADGLVLPSTNLRGDTEAFMGRPLAHTTVIHNPVVTPALRAAAKAAIAGAPPREGRPRQVCALSRLHAHKGHDALIRAFAEATAGTDTRLAVVGDGPARGDLEALARAESVADRVDFLGYQGDPLPILAASDVFAHASRYEGFCNVIVEAMHFGLPLVVTDCPSGPAEILEGGRHGLLVPVDDHAALTAALRDALDGRAPVYDPEAAHARFEEDVIVDRFLDLLGLDAPGPGRAGGEWDGPEGAGRERSGA